MRHAIAKLLRQIADHLDPAPVDAIMGISLIEARRALADMIRGQLDASYRRTP